MAELIVFADANFGGIHTHIYAINTGTIQLDTLKIIGSLTGSSLPSADGWDKQVSSFIVVSGTWQFFVGNGRQGGPQSPFPDGSPKMVAFVKNENIDNDAVTSVDVLSL